MGRDPGAGSNPRSCAVHLEGSHLEPLELARQIVDLVAEKLGSDIVMMEIGHLSVIADYFVICSGETERQLDAIREEVSKELKKDGRYALRTDGAPSSGWILMDYGSVMVHIMAPSQRERYSLERLWSDGKVLLRLE